MLCLLAALDLWRQYAINSEDYWFAGYGAAVRSSPHFWKLGFHIEDLEQKIDYQTKRLEITRHDIGVLTPPLRHSTDSFTKRRNIQSTVHNLVVNDTSVVQIRCQDLMAESGGNLLRVGFSDFRADPMDKCQIFTSTSALALGPHMMFEVVQLDEDAFALKNIGNDLFIQVVAPPPESYSLPWKLVLGSWSVGAAERFRISPDGNLYSSVVGGFLQCSNDKPVLGYPGTYSAGSRFILEKVTPEDTYEALELSELSSKIIAIQVGYVAEKTADATKEASSLSNGGSSPSKNFNPAPTGEEMVKKIAITIPMTSKGTDMTQVTESPLWSNLFDSFMKTIDWRSNKYEFRIYLGLDRADPLYDTGDAWSEMREEFKQRASFRMTEQLMEQNTIDEVLEKRLSLKLMHFDHLEGAPTQVVSQLVLQAYSDMFDYFYQVNDDTILVSPNWAVSFIKTLEANPLIPNFGVTGPKDVNNDKIFTHSFTHRTHIDIFGHLFPPSFKNWWSDDWITTVYGSEHTFRPSDVEIQHNVGAQKVGGQVQRYEVDMGAQLRLKYELLQGYVQIDKWLKKKSLPRMSLPSICGYIPLVGVLSKTLKEKVKTVTPPHDHDIIKK